MRNQLLRLILNTENRLSAHLLFWASYFVYRVMIYGDVINTYENVAYVQLLEMPVKVGVVYLNLYWFMPFFLKKKKNFSYGISIVGAFILATFLQLQTIRFCMELGIYTYYPERLLTPRKWLATFGHIFNIVALTMVIKILKDAYQNQQKVQKIIREKLQTELKFLKAQINPHFLFNTLNNLYALILTKSEAAPEVVLKLSDLMSYTLYESERRTVALSREIRHLNDYIELEKLRFGNELSVNVSVEGATDKFQITPLILLPFVENAFKHGTADSQQEAWIKVFFKLDGRYLSFLVENRYLPDKKESLVKGGVGLKNVQRRLQILYPQKHQLTFKQEGDNYSIELLLQLEETHFVKHETEMFNRG